jgi:RNA polymerase sigma factor (sigma-70 family)
VSTGVAFEEVFDELFAVAYRVALRMTGSTTAAEDATSEAMTRAYVRWSRLAGATVAQAWVVRTTTNIILDGYRRDRRNRTPSASAPEPSEADGDDGSLAVAMAALPRRQRQVVALRYLADLSETQVAEALGLSVGSIRTHLRRGLAALRITLTSPAEPTDA